MTKAEIEQKREERRKQYALAHEAQSELDEAAIFEQEEKLGPERIVVAVVSAWQPGIPTKCAYRLPGDDEFRRYQDMCKARGERPGQPLEAANLVGHSCLLYPEKEVYTRVLELSPGLHVNAAVAAVNRVAGRIQEDAKS